MRSSSWMIWLPRIARLCCAGVSAGTDYSVGEDGGLVKTDDQWKQYNDINYRQSSGIEQMSWFYFRPGLEALPTSGTILSPSNTAEFASSLMKTTRRSS